MADAAAQYKKQDGTVSVSADGKTVAWKSASGALPPLSIAIADIASRSTRVYALPKKVSSQLTCTQICSKPLRPPPKLLSRLLSRNHRRKPVTTPLPSPPLPLVMTSKL